MMKIGLIIAGFELGICFATEAVRGGARLWTHAQVASMVVLGLVCGAISWRKL